MSASHLPAMCATALETVAALARYERHVRRLAGTWLDLDLYRSVSDEVDAIGKQCALFPRLRVAWSALLVSHTELVYALLRGGDQDTRPPHEEVPRRLQRHLESIDVLARRCLLETEPYAGVPVLRPC